MREFVKERDETNVQLEIQLEMEAFRKISPLEYHRKFLQQGIRPDGRLLTKNRKITIKTGSLLFSDQKGPSAPLTVLHL